MSGTLSPPLVASSWANALEVTPPPSHLKRIQHSQSPKPPNLRQSQRVLYLDGFRVDLLSAFRSQLFHLSKIENWSTFWKAVMGAADRFTIRWFDDACRPLWKIFRCIQTSQPNAQHSCAFATGPSQPIGDKNSKSNRSAMTQQKHTRVSKNYSATKKRAQKHRLKPKVSAIDRHYVPALLPPAAQTSSLPPPRLPSLQTCLRKLPPPGAHLLLTRLQFFPPVPRRGLFDLLVEVHFSQGHVEVAPLAPGAKATHDCCATRRNQHVVWETKTKQETERGQAIF